MSAMRTRGRHTAVALCLALTALTAVPEAARGVDKVSVVGLFKDRAVLMIDGKRRMLGVGERSPEGVALLGADSETAVLEIDGKRGRYRLGTHIGTGFRAPEQAALRIYPTATGMYEVTGSINGFPVPFIVDTGATLVSMSGREADRIGIPYRLEGTAAVSSTASGLSRIWVVRLRQVKIGEIAIADVEAAVHEGAFPARVLLGNSFLSRLDIRREAGALELRRRF
ncbi:MAG: TIGR02281 family clan AA aspartic protease [Ectothiorhodospiraceae bacterium]|nr:TIGR02281 family clan AA aspartic protease [Ectothiorhodospiraceae bacterium]